MYLSLKVVDSDKKFWSYKHLHGFQLPIFLMHINFLMLLFTDDVSLSYIGLLYYEWNEKEYLMTFTASKKLNCLLEVQ